MHIGKVLIDTTTVVKINALYEVLTVLCNGGCLLGNWGTAQPYHLPAVETDQFLRSLALWMEEEGGVHTHHLV